MGDKRLIIFDMDGCLYEHAEGWREAYIHAEAMVGVNHLNLEYEEAKKLALASFIRHGAVGREWEARGLRRQFAHQAYHDGCDLSKVIAPQGIREKIERLANDPNNILAVYTHGSRSWMLDVLGKLDILDCFDTALLYAHEDVYFASKSKNVACFSQIRHDVQRRYSCQIFWHDAVMVEDTSRNLLIPHLLGMETHIVTHGKKPSDMICVADYAHDDIGSVLDFLNGEYPPDAEVVNISGLLEYRPADRVLDN